jgi:serine/threonine protein kinase/Tol biopolymer transport system component
MTPDRYRHINALADAAMDLPAVERAAFLDAACAGDTELRDHVARLIAAHSSDNEFLEASLLEVLAKDKAATPLYNDLTGRQIHHYKVISRLGAGGIGEVWLARDIQLTREVAIKLLSPQFAGDPYHLRRFRLEARAASTLNHPNIVTIYEISKADGVDFIAQEFVPGETLRQRLRNGPVEVAQALDIGSQTAAALATAHAAGIVHRDIKPENIMLRPDGLVKVLDFGLAQFVERSPTGGGDTGSLPGIVLGTVRYMSPEQARGLPVDTSTDIFSLGVVLYEMLAGTPPFSGPTPTDVLAAILNQDPPPLTGPAAAVPAELERIVRRCLDKDPAKRYGSAAELRRGLRRLAATDTPSDELATPARGSGPLPSGSGEWRRKRWVVPLSAALAGLALVAAATIFISHRHLPDIPFNTMTITRVATRGESTGAAISPDGKYVAYVLRDESGESIWTTQLATGSDVRVIAAEPGEHVGIKFAPDGAYLYYRLNTSAGAHNLYRVPAIGGVPLKVMEDVPGSFAFSPDGKRLALVRIDSARMEASLTVANGDGSETRTIRRRSRPEYYSRNGIAWSPDGASIACFAGNATGYSAQAFQLVSVRVADGIEIPISPETWAWVDSVVWSADGVLAVDASRERSDAYQIWLVAVSRSGITRVTNDLSNYRRVTLSGDGKTLGALQTRREIDLWVAPFGAPERAARLASENVHGMDSLVWAPHGEIIFTALSGPWRNLWTVDPDVGAQRRLSTGPSDKQEVALTRDGRYVLFSSGGSIWRMDVDSGNPVQLTHGSWDVHPTSSADSRFVVYASFRNWSPAIWGKPALWRVPIDGGSPAPVTEEAASFPQVSPDGSKIACDYYPGQNPEYSASPMAVFSADGHRLQVFENISLGDSPVSWTPDGQALIYRVRTKRVANLWRQPLGGGSPVPMTNFRTDDLFDFAFSADFKRVALARGKETSDLVLISGFR